MAKNNRNRGNSRSDESMFSGWSNSAKERPLATAAAVGAAAAAGAFLWSRRNQISDQISNLSDQIGEWTESMRSGSSASDQFETTGASSGTGSLAGAGTSQTGSSSFQSSGTGSSRTTGSKGSTTRGRGGRKSGMSETGGGNASLGAHSGTTGTGGGTI